MPTYRVQFREKIEFLLLLQIISKLKINPRVQFTSLQLKFVIVIFALISDNNSETFFYLVILIENVLQNDNKFCLFVLIVVSKENNEHVHVLNRV
jgi:hypothetical protein